MKKFLVSLLCLVMMFTTVPAAAFADTEAGGDESSDPPQNEAVVTTEDALREAIDENKSVITLGGEIALAKPLKIESGKNIVLSGNTLTAGENFQTEGSKNALLWISGGEVTLRDITVNANGKSRVIHADAGKLTMESGSHVTGGYINNSYIAGVYMTGTASFEMKEGAISGNVIEGQYADDGYLQYSADLWIGANAKGAVNAVSGGTIGSVFVNANEYSAQDQGGFTVSGGTINTVFAEKDADYSAKVAVGTNAVIKTIHVKSGDTFKNTVESTDGQVEEISLADNIDLKENTAMNRNSRIAGNGRKITVKEGAAVTVSADMDASGVTFFAEPGAAITNDSDKPVTAETPEGTVTLQKGEKVEVEKPAVPPVDPPVQKPTIEAEDHVTVTLRENGTSAEIKVADGYELIDVMVNEVSMGAVTTLTGLKTGDIVKIMTKKIEEPSPEEIKNAKLRAGVEATTLVARSKAYKGKTKITWTKSWGYKVDGYNVYKSVKRDSGYVWMGKTKKMYMYHTKNLKKGTRYYYQVKGYRTIGGEKAYTQLSKKAIRTAK